MKKYYNYFTTPLTIYIVIFILAAILFVVSLLLNISDKIFNILIGISCSLFASLIVSLLIDYSNTKASVSKDNYEYCVLVESLKNRCISLIDNVVFIAETKIRFSHNINTKFCYNEWIDVLFSFDNDLSEEDNIILIQQYITLVKQLKDANDNLIGNIKYFLNNKNIDNGFKIKIENLSRFCNLIIQNSQLKNYHFCKEIIQENLSNEIVMIFPELKSEFDKKYDSLIITFDLLSNKN